MKKLIFKISLITFLVIFPISATFTFAQQGKDGSNKPTLRYEKALEKINQRGEGAQLSTEKSLKQIDDILKATENYYKKLTKLYNQTDPTFEVQLTLTEAKKEQAKKDYNDAKDEMKSFQKAEKGLAGATNQLRVKGLKFVKSFEEYKQIVAETILSVKEFNLRMEHQDISSQSATDSAIQTPSSAPKGDDE